jgi:hypothetical protein
VELKRLRHLHVVARAAADQWHLGAEHPVGAAHDLSPIARKAVREEQETPNQRTASISPLGRVDRADAS